MAVRNERTRTQVLQDHFRRFSGVEKAFYGSIALTAVILAISIVLSL